MKKRVKILILLVTVMPQCVLALPTDYKNFCLKADSLCRIGKYEEAKKNLISFFWAWGFYPNQHAAEHKVVESVGGG